ncbi:hypothetical protein C8R44DRAFT_396667 [Mycena epipterygia]|nr:hypothetical protein C8R44DRAFT_396667 [Mycena epipterygia]
MAPTAARRRPGSSACVYLAGAPRTSGVAQAQHAHSYSTRSHAATNATDGELDAHFYAQVWCTYRAGFEPICNLPSLVSLPPPLFVAANANPHAYAHTHNHTGSRNPRCRRARATGQCRARRLRRPADAAAETGVDERCGVGCMLRTAQSLLATALQRVRDPPWTQQSRPSPRARRRRTRPTRGYRSPLFFLLHRHTGGRPVLPRPAPCGPSRSAQAIHGRGHTLTRIRRTPATQPTTAPAPTSLAPTP